jgi:nitrous oxide reductase accessory protein NosL
MMKIGIIAIVALSLTACATTSGVMEAEGGTYIISARAAPARGGTAGANAIAYEEAQKFCAAKGGRAIVVDARERDVYQSSAGASWSAYGGSAGGGTFAAGTVNLRFRCEN